MGCCGHASLILQVRFPPLPFIGFSPNPSGTSGQVCGPSGFLAELHSSIWRLWPCILAILRDKITSLIGNLLHNFKFHFFYPRSTPGDPLRPGLHHSHSCIAACPYHLAKIHDGLWIRGGYIPEHRSHFGSRYTYGLMRQRKPFQVQRRARIAKRHPCAK